MKIDGSYLLDGPPQLVWALLHDSQAVRRLLPGCDQIYHLDTGSYHVVLTIPEGPFHGRYDGIIDAVDTQPVEQFTLSLNGSGAQHIFRGEGVVSLHNEEGKTRLIYEGEFEADGPLAARSPRLVLTTANYLVRSFLESLDEQLQQLAGRPRDNGLPPQQDVLQARKRQTIDVHAFVAELRRDRWVAASVLLAALLAVFSLLGVFFVGLLLVRWGARARAERQAELLGAATQTGTRDYLGGSSANRR